MDVRVSEQTGSSLCLPNTSPSFLQRSKNLLRDLRKSASCTSDTYFSQHLWTDWSNFRVPPLFRWCILSAWSNSLPHILIVKRTSECPSLSLSLSGCYISPVDDSGWWRWRYTLTEQRCTFRTAIREKPVLTVTGRIVKHRSINRVQKHVGCSVYLRMKLSIWRVGCEHLSRTRPRFESRLPSHLNGNHWRR